MPLVDHRAEIGGLRITSYNVCYTKLLRIGFLAEALDRRRRAGAGPIVIASCDNIPANGHLLAATLGAYVRRVSPVLADWIDANVSFPVRNNFV